MKDKIKQAIIAWLGGAYDEHNKRFLNPDYYNQEQVDELTDDLLVVIKQGIPNLCASCTKPVNPDNCIIWVRDGKIYSFCDLGCFL